MNERLLTNKSNQDIYEPFQSPPNIQKAQNHRKAMSVGHDFQQDQDPKICPCCENVIDKEPLSLCCQDEDLLYLGVGYPLFYKLTRYIASIIASIFIISGSAYYFMVTIKCQAQCIYFFGIPIINMEIPPRQALQITDVFNVITSFVILVIVLYIKSKVHQDIAQLQSNVISPQQYTIIIQNLPQDVNQEQLCNWSKQNLGHKPILVNFAYNVNQLAQTYSNRQQLTININKLNIKLSDQQDLLVSRNKSSMQDQINQYKKEIVKCDKILQSYKKQTIPCRKIGTAFLTFSKQKVAHQIVKKYQTTFIRSFFNNIFSAIRRAPLSYKNSTIILNRAPAPRQIIWKNLSFSFFRSIIADIIFIATMIILIYIAFKIQFIVVGYAYQLRVQSKQTGNAVIIFQALIMSLIVVLLNSLLRLVIKFFATIKKYYSYTSYHSSFCFYYSLLYSLTTCFMIYIVHGHRQSQERGTSRDQDYVLMYDIHLIMLANAFSEPLFKIFDPVMWWRVIWRNYVKNLKPQKNPYTQAYIHELWQGYQISNADNYQYIFRILIITTWYAHAAPLGVVISLLALCFDYWVGKYLLLRVYKRPQNISKQIASPIIMSLQLMPLIYICGALQYTYKVSDSENIFAFLTQFFEYGLTTTVLFISILGYLVFVKPKQYKISQTPYDEIQLMFPYNYETQNPITKLKGQIKYLYGILKRGTNRNDTRIIGQLLEMKRKSQEDFEDRQSEIFKIKRKQLKKISTINSVQMKDLSLSISSD